VRTYRYRFGYCEFNIPENRTKLQILIQSWFPSSSTLHSKTPVVLTHLKSDAKAKPAWLGELG
jgi:hypothetical protein